MITPMPSRRSFRAVGGPFFLSLVALGAAPLNAMERIFSDVFSDDLASWVVEQQPGGSVEAQDGRLVIADKRGCTVWFREKLEAPIVITYTVTASTEERVSDLNCFWMATEPDLDGLFDSAHERTGAFASYDGLETYYVGYGGNYNSTTRFRRYTGDGKRPLLPEHDLSAEAYLIEGDQPYAIRVVAAGGRAQYYRNGELLFDYPDDEPLTEGWFGFRTVWSRLVIEDFAVWQLTEAEIPKVLEGQWTE